MKIAVIGAGYVGLSISVILSQHNDVFVYDIDKKKIESINNRIVYFKDLKIEEFFRNKKLNLFAYDDIKIVLDNADYVVIATPTNYDEKLGMFDTKSIEETIEKVKKFAKNAHVIIKSTIPVGYTEEMCKKYNKEDILFSPEFLREGNALFDNLYPSRIIIGCVYKSESLNNIACLFANLLIEGALKTNIPVIITGVTEAESIKLFANTYLAMRVAFFNELDYFCEKNNLSVKDVIDGISFDPRIGAFYNNPSFGYGGYCLPKDTKQIVASYNDIPNILMKSIVKANKLRKECIVDNILNKLKGINEDNIVVGIYRLTMKHGSDNFRDAAILDIIKLLREKGDVTIMVYEPELKDMNIIEKYVDCFVGLNELKTKANLILANRCDENLKDIKDKVYTRDIFFRD